MFSRLGHLVSRRWRLVIGCWLLFMLVVQWASPRWDDVTYDGDLAYMPARMTSVRAEELLERAFPGRRAKSEMVLVTSRDDGPLTPEDFAAIDRMAARLHNLQGVSDYTRAKHLRENPDETLVFDGQQVTHRQHAVTLAKRAAAAWEEALRLDNELGAAHHNLALYYASVGRAEDAQQQARLASDFLPPSHSSTTDVLPDIEPLPILDVWTRHTDVVGSKLRSRDRRAELLVVRLSQEFMATDNIRVLERIEGELNSVRDEAEMPSGLTANITGSAAVGGDMLRSAAESIANTELYTVVLVVLILALVYRSPLLVAVPLITIIVSVAVSTGLVAALTQLNQIEGLEFWNFRVFTTTKIFVVVILFGAGTDFCLFLISRYREELDQGHHVEDAVARALDGVGEALAASALTTIVGLGTMYFADFGKFRNSGPAIGLCLAVTLAACLTLAPALLRGFGQAIFWPLASPKKERRRAAGVAFWERLARLIVSYPGRLLVGSILIMAPLAAMGTRVAVTYDFLSELDAQRPSKQGASQMARHFHVGETAPAVILAHVPGGDLDSNEGKQALNQITRDLYVDGVLSVRSLAEPRGETPTGFSIKKAALQNHELTRSLYLSKLPTLDGDVARIEVVLSDDPFSLDAIGTLNRVQRVVNERSRQADSFWHGTEFVFAGTTAAIRDLRQVTRSDNLRIQVLVVLAVLAVLLVILRRPVVCVYLILSVLFSYYVTMGVAEQFFVLVYGDSFQGLDWKVPLFLFVILVAIGQDYNIYLATRVFEEQASHGLFGGLRRAIVRTGGIITSCGVIMAGTFVSMTSGSLRGIVELGFALSLGVLLDTFIVRPVLVPAFLALLFRRHAARPTGRVKVARPHGPLLCRESQRSHTR